MDTITLKRVGNKLHPGETGCRKCGLNPGNCNIACSNNNKYIFERIGFTGHVEGTMEVEIQSEFEWKEERFKNLKKIHRPVNSDFSTEYLNLGAWLLDNKPEKWVQCDWENTIVGSKIKSKSTDNIYVVEHFIEHPCNNQFNMVVNDGKNSRQRILHDYKVNVVCRYEAEEESWILHTCPKCYFVQNVESDIENPCCAKCGELFV